MRTVEIKNTIAVAIVLSLIAVASRTTLAQPEPVIELRLNEPGGTIAKDSSGNGNDGVLVGDLEHVLAYDRLGIRIHGRAEHIEIPTSPSGLGIGPDESWTAGAWGRPIHNGGTLLDVGGARLGVGEEVGRYTLTVDGDPAQKTNITVVENGDPWKFFAMIFCPGPDDEEDKLTISIDGVTQLEKDVPKGLVNNDKSPIVIGEGMDGVVDDIGIYPFALLVPDIQEAMRGDQDYRGQIGVQYWHTVVETDEDDVSVYREEDLEGSLNECRVDGLPPQAPSAEGITVEGYFYPDKTCEHTFWISGGGQGFLYLSTDDDGDNRRHIADIPQGGQTERGQFDKYPEQESKPICLTAGKKYWFDAHVDGEHLSVAYKGPGMDTREIIPGRMLSPSPSSEALNPDPANFVTGVPLDVNPTFSPGVFGDTHRVYFGTTYPPPHFGDQTGNTINLPPLTPGTIYYWRVDEIGYCGEDVWPGDTWTFTTVELSAHDLNVANGTQNLPLGTVFTWTQGQGEGLVTQRVYWGQDENAVASGEGEPAAVLGPDENSFTPQDMVPGATYYMRIESQYAGGVWDATDVQSYTILPDGGPENGLVGQYFQYSGASSPAIPFDVPILTRVDPQIYFNWGNGSPDPAMLSNDLFSVTWIGNLLVPLDGIQLGTVSDDGVRVYLDGELIIDAWRNDPGAQVSSPWIEIAPGQYRFNMEYYEYGGGADCFLFWKFMDGKLDWQPIPWGAFTVPEAPIITWPTPGANVDPLNPGVETIPARGTVAVHFDTWENASTNVRPEDFVKKPENLVKRVEVPVAPDTVDTLFGEIGPLDPGTSYTVTVTGHMDDGTDREGDAVHLITLPNYVVDDFEWQNDWNSQIWLFWDGWWVNGGGGYPGFPNFPLDARSPEVVHSGNRAGVFTYDNDGTDDATGDPRDYFSEITTDLPHLGDMKALVGENGQLGLWVTAQPNGQTTIDGDDITITGGGHDIWGSDDGFRFVFQAVAPGASEYDVTPVTITARIPDMTATHDWAKAGVMIRDTQNADSTHAMMAVTPNQGVSFQRRTTTGGNSESDTETGVGTPTWVRLTRDESGTFTAAHSPDGENWNTLGDPVYIPMNSYVGLAVTSHHRSAMCTAVFSDVEITGDVSGEWQSQDIGIKKNDAEQLYVALEDTDGHVKVVNHPDPCATTLDSWQEWRIPLKEFSDGGVDLTSVAKLHIGVGDRGNPQQGGSGRLFLDDIGLHMPEILKMRLVARPQASDWTDTTLPEHESTYHQWQTFYLELWAQTEYLEAGSDALCSAFADLELTDGIASAESVAHSPDFASLATGTVEPNLVDELGGCTLTGGLGISPQWALIARVEMTARAVGQMTASLSLADTDCSIIGHGVVPWYQINLGSADVTVETEPQTSVYDLDGDGTIGPGDFSWFILYWLRPVSDSDGDVRVSAGGCDFDGDGFVGPGDLSWFATAWLKPWDDPSIQYPPDDSEQPAFAMLFAAAPSAADVEVRPVIVASPSASDSTEVLPASISSAAQGQDYYVEIWAGDVGGTNTGLTSVYVNLDLSAGASASVQSIDHGGIFTVFPSGTVSAGGIEDLGGSALSAAGIGPQWVRVATVKMRAEASGPIACSLAPSTVGVAALGRGLVPSSEIELGASADCFGEAYSTYNDWVSLGKPACLCTPYQCDGDADGATQGLQDYRVSTNDLDALIKSWQKPVTDPDFNPCADFDHKAEGLAEYRVGTRDLNILIANWKKKDTDLPGDCPRDE